MSHRGFNHEETDSENESDDTSDESYGKMDEDEEEDNDNQHEEDGEVDVATKEKKRITELYNEDHKRGLIPGKDYYILDKVWWKQWKNYTGFEYSHYSHYGKYPRPDPIDNASLLDTDGVNLKRNISDETNFIIISKEVWDQLVEWYGGGPPIARKCLEVIGHYSKKKFVEVRPLIVKVIYSKKPQKPFLAEFSKATKIGEFVDTMEKILHFDRKKIRVFDFHQGNKLKHLDDMNQFFDEVQILDGQFMLIEEQKKDGNWPGDRLYQKYGYSRNSYMYRDPTPPGKTGLVNLGNTCFMNSALQCLSHTAPLVDFFLSQGYLKDLNRKNPLGMQGEIADEFSALLKEIWSSQTSVSEPRQFKKAIEKFAPRFSGYQQHDSQELLAFLLDGLHEDLNRVIDKPFVAIVEGGDGKSDVQVAKESWDGHLKRNKSIIVDLIQGQLKSTLTCPVDQKVSITFDPFMYLTVQLPVDSTRKITVKVYPLKGLPKIYSVVVEKDAYVKELKKALSKLCGIEPEKLVLVDMFRHQFHALLTDKHEVDDIRDSDKIHAHEILLVPEVETVVREVDNSEQTNESPKNDNGENNNQEGSHKLEVIDIESQNLEIENDDEIEINDEDDEDEVEIIHLQIINRVQEHYSTSTFGTPFVASVPSKITYRQLYAHLIDRLKIFLKKEVDPNLPPPLEDENLENNAHSDDESSKVQPIFTIQPTPKNYSQSYKFINNDEPLQLSEQMIVSLVWSGDDKDEYYDDEKSELSEKHSSMEEDSSNSAISKAMNLAECLNLFNKEEQLGPEDAWYCSGCKEHRQAFKKFDIWSAPKILVIHLKRFSYRQRFREKLDHLIDFPLESLDMSKYVIGPTESQPIYDLYAVSNHYGSMGGGHYTAYAKHRDDNWYLFDDQSVRQVSPKSVISDAAYVLFYKRKDVEWPQFNPAYDTLKDDDEDEEEESDKEEEEKKEDKENKDGKEENNEKDKTEDKEKKDEKEENKTNTSENSSQQENSDLTQQFQTMNLER